MLDKRQVVRVVSHQRLVNRKHFQTIQCQQFEINQHLRVMVVFVQQNVEYIVDIVEVVALVVDQEEEEVQEEVHHVVLVEEMVEEVVEVVVEVVVVVREEVLVVDKEWEDMDHVYLIEVVIHNEMEQDIHKIHVEVVVMVVQMLKL